MENIYISGIDLCKSYIGEANLCYKNPRLSCMTFPHCCKWCTWHDEFSWACSNGRSPYCADFTDEDCTCEYWEREV
jgi:hypothetical protein